MSALQELDAALQPMLLLKPPGVSGSKIKEITALCVANVKVALTVPATLCKPC